jgi:hypothetical protein
MGFLVADDAGTVLPSATRAGTSKG